MNLTVIGRTVLHSGKLFQENAENSFWSRSVLNVHFKKHFCSIQREDGAFWMCYKDWIELFSSFDVCLLPSKFSESRSGPCFDAESVVNGVFEEDQPVIKVKMSVGAKRNVFLQCLFDCNIEFAKTNQFISIDLKDENEEYIKPILPNKYEELDPPRNPESNQGSNQGQIRV